MFKNWVLGLLATTSLLAAPNQTFRGNVHITGSIQVDGGSALIDSSGNITPNALIAPSGTVATAGFVRMPNNTATLGLAWRDAGNTTNLRLYVDSGNNLNYAGGGIALGTNGAVTVTPFSAGNTSTALTLDWNNGVIQKCTATGNVTFTLNNPVAGTLYQIEITQDSTGSRTYTWPGAVKWTGGSAPTGSGANKIDLIALYYDGTSYLGRSNLNY